MKIYIVFIILALLFAAVQTYFNFTAPEWYCHLIGIGGAAHVPANCIKFFMN